MNSCCVIPPHIPPCADISSETNLVAKDEQRHGQGGFQKAPCEATATGAGPGDRRAPLLGQPQGLPHEHSATRKKTPLITILQNWLQSPLLVRHMGPVSHVHFNPTAPHSIAASASAGVHIYKPKSSTKQKTISRFKDVAYCPQFRGEHRHSLASCTHRPRRSPRQC